MSEVLLSKQMPLSLTEPERMVMRRVLFESVDGLDERSKKGWRRFWNMIVKAEPVYPSKIPVSEQAIDLMRKVN